VAFRVDPKATKVEIRQAVEKIFKVKVRAVNVQCCAGKKKRFGRNVGRRPDWKKAVVTLHPESKIEIIEGVS
jgi:large subunit ribosomal protein L23